MLIAGIQAGPYKSETVFWEKFEEGIKELVKEKNPYLIALSELMHIPYFAVVNNDEAFKFAQTINGDVVTKTVELSKKYNVHIVGTLFEKEEANHGGFNYYNSAFVCSPSRGLLGIYRKVHLPKVNHPSLITNEKYYFEQFGGGGTEFPIFTLDNGVKIGCLICFDRSFPEAWKCLSVQGAQLVVVPTATFGFRYDLYVKELQIRAMENNVFVLAVNKAGEEVYPEDAPIRNNFGCSNIIDPRGEILDLAGDEPWSTTAQEISISAVEESKSLIDWELERKPEVYKKYLSIPLKQNVKI